MFLNIRDVNHSITCDVAEFIDPLNFNNYYPLELLDLSNDVKNKLIQVPQFNEIYEFKIIYEFIKENEDLSEDLQISMDRSLLQSKKAQSLYVPDSIMQLKNAQLMYSNRLPETVVFVKHILRIFVIIMCPPKQ